MSQLPVTDRQRELISILAKELAMDDDTLRAFVDDQCPDVTLDDASGEPTDRRDASQLITAMQRERVRRAS